MENNKLKLYSISKFINQEILIEELLRVRGISKDSFLNRYSKKRKSLKFRIIFTKLFYSVIFGVLPVIPLRNYLAMTETLQTGGIYFDLIIFGGSLVFVFFFILQFLNIFFMSMTEVSLIISGSIFEWLETLPIPKTKLAKLKYLTIFHSFDIPIIFIMFSFPIAMVILTLDFVVFLVCLAISFLNMMFSLSILVLISHRISKILDINQLSSKKTLWIRLFNTFGYVLVMFGSIFLIQWAINSTYIFLQLFIGVQNTALLNLILSTIPYPFSSCYWISFALTNNNLHPHYWISLISGMGLFATFTWWALKRAITALKKLDYPEFEGFRKYRYSDEPKKILKIKIKRRRPVLAHFIKDLLITSRNLKVFLSVITPIIISIVGTYTFNATLLGNLVPLDMNFFYNFGLILAYQPIIIGILLYSILYIEGSKESLLFAVPIKPKNQAKAKLLYIWIIQTISVFAPYLIYVADPRFLNLLIHIVITLPFVWIFLLTMFLMTIYYFGRAKYKYLIEEINPENKIFKWFKIYATIYFLYFVLLSNIVTLYLNLAYKFFLFNFIIIIAICYTILFLVFNIMFAPKLKPKKRGRDRYTRQVPITVTSQGAKNTARQEPRAYYKQIKLLDNSLYCPMCKSKLVSNKYSYCHECGIQFNWIESNQNTPNRTLILDIYNFCPNCGFYIKHKPFRFCFKCGIEFTCNKCYSMKKVNFEVCPSCYR
ncbi:MAG: hypothetical protein ACFFCI_08015 [Promethearchaeota archaeon]